MKWFGVIVAILVIGVVIVAALYATGSFLPGSIDQEGDGEVIAYIHPSSTVQVTNPLVGDTIDMVILDVNAIVDDQRPAGMQTFSISPKTVNCKVTYTINGVGTISETYQWTVGGGHIESFSSEPAQAFGMKETGSYVLTVTLIDLPSEAVRDTAQFTVEV